MLDEIAFLGFIVNAEGIKADPSKVEAILNWPTPTSITGVRAVHGLASFYRHFIANNKQSFYGQRRQI